MSTAEYNQMYQANQGAMSGIYNQPGTADPRTIMAQHQQMQQAAPQEAPLPPAWQRQEANQPPSNGSGGGGGGGGYYSA